MKCLLLMLHTKLYKLYKLHVNVKSPIFVQYSVWNGEKCENLKKVSSSIKISKFWNSILKYLPTKTSGSFWYKIFSRCVVVIYSAMIHLWLMKQFPSDLDITPSISSPYTTMFSVAPNSNMDHVLPLKFRKIFSSDLNSNFRLVSGVWEDSACTVGW